ncbi:MAG TPA: D-alanyl-D-alanine carboxypeptidase family protein [Chloroflexota bacterium]|nr:D-alanyl-D-alanine carboxypeptidase family protein [Chloroflexota bacterium]
MRSRVASVLAGVVWLTGCQAGGVPLAPTAAATGGPERTELATLVPVAATPLPPTAILTQRPTAPPTVTPPPPTATAVPATATAVPATATPAAPTPTPDPTRAAQQHFCDIASPPAHLPLPPVAPFVRITPAQAVTQPTVVAAGPRREGSDPAPHVSAASVAVLDEASGNLLYQQDAFARRAPASITKIATTIVALERGPDIKTVYTTTVSASALVPCDGSSVMGLEPNDQVKLETLLFGMMLPSGNDAAEQVAVLLGGSRERYVAWMNEKVASLQLRDTHFVTPSGMDADEHYSSAYDMALLGRYAMQNPEFRVLASTPYFVGDEYYMHNLNALLTSYPGADGVKIGYTEIAGRTIVASATRDGHRVYVSLMASRNLAADCIALFDWVWKSFRW